MFQIKNIFAKLMLDTSPFDWGIKKAEASAKKAQTGMEAGIVNMNRMVRAGAAGAIVLLTRQLAGVAKEAEKVATAFRKGEISGAEMADAFVKMIPVTGQVYELIRAAQEVFTGDKARFEIAIAQQLRFARAMELTAKNIERQRKALESVQEVQEDTRRALALAQAPDDAAKRALGVRFQEADTIKRIMDAARMPGSDAAQLSGTIDRLRGQVLAQEAEVMRLTRLAQYTGLQTWMNARVQQQAILERMERELRTAMEAQAAIGEAHRLAGVETMALARQETQQYVDLWKSGWANISRQAAAAGNAVWGSLARAQGQVETIRKQLPNAAVQAQFMWGPRIVTSADLPQKTYEVAREQLAVQKDTLGAVRASPRVVFKVLTGW